MLAPVGRTSDDKWWDPDIPHGTGTGYAYWRCRCRQCTAFWAERQNQQDIRRATLPDICWSARDAIPEGYRGKKVSAVEIETWRRTGHWGRTVHDLTSLFAEVGLHFV